MAAPLLWACVASGSDGQTQILALVFIMAVNAALSWDVLAAASTGLNMFSCSTNGSARVIHDPTESALAGTLVKYAIEYAPTSWPVLVRTDARGYGSSPRASW